MSKKKIAIVGAGPGGLTAGMILSHRGFDVTIFEKNPHVGGRNAAIKIDGFTFDTGPTFLMMTFILKEMFAETGRKLEDYLHIYDLDPMYRLVFDDKIVNVSHDHEKMEKEIEKNFPGQGKNLKKYLKKEGKRFEALFPCLQHDYSVWYKMLNKDLMLALPKLDLHRSVFSALGDYFNIDKLKLVFTFQSKYLGMSAWECPAAFAMIGYIEHAWGIQHVKGGLNAISHAMEKVINEEGGKIEFNKTVKQLITVNGEAKGVLLEDGTKFMADEVIVNADFSYSVTQIMDKNIVKKYSPEKLKKRKYSCSIFMMYLGIDKIYDNVPHHNVFFASKYKQNVDDIFKNMKLSEDISFYIQNASVTDPTLAPSGKSTIYVLVPVPNNKSGIDWDKEKEAFKEKIISEIEKRTELKDIRRHIVVQKIITPADWEKQYNVYYGATFNLGHNLTQMLYFRPRNKFECIKNTWLTGGGTHPGSGLPTIYESARISSNLICKKYGIKYEKPTSLKNKEK